MSPPVRGAAFGLLLGLWLQAPAARAESTAYDALGRVVSAVTDDGQQTLYTYDKAGNRKTVATSASGVSDAPAAADVSVAAAYGQGATKTIKPLPTGGQPLTIVGVAPPQFGGATFTATKITYTLPTTNVAGTDAFAYTIANAAGLTGSGIIRVTLTNPAPIANPDAVTTPQETAASFDPAANDTDPGGALPLTVTAVGTPAHGTAIINATVPSVTYTPALGYWGQDSFGYTITNTASVSASSTIAITVTATPPVGGAVAIGTAKNLAVTFDPRIYDSDPQGLPLTVTSVTAPVHGTAAVNGGASITYTPATNYAGADSFSYSIANSGGGTATATVTATVGAPLSALADKTSWNWRKSLSGNVAQGGPVNATASGGQGPYTFLWQCLSGQCSGARAATATAPAWLATRWTASVPQDGQPYVSVWQCQVTDQLGAVANTPSVTVTFTWDNNN